MCDRQLLSFRSSYKSQLKKKKETVGTIEEKWDLRAYTQCNVVVLLTFVLFIDQRLFLNSLTSVISATLETLGN